jgi:hypothetical protein
VLERPLPDGPSAIVLIAQHSIWTADESRGSLLAGIRGRGQPTGIYLRRAGEDTLRRVSRLRPGTVSISTGAMTNQSRGEKLYAAATGRPDRWDPIARGEVDEATADAKYAYWLQDDERITRVNPGLSHRHAEAFVPPRLIGSLAVTGGTLYYTDRASGDLYEFRHPSWARTGDGVPVGR